MRMRCHMLGIRRVRVDTASHRRGVYAMPLHLAACWHLNCNKAFELQAPSYQPQPGGKCTYGYERAVGIKVGAYLSCVEVTGPQAPGGDVSQQPPRESEYEQGEEATAAR